MPNPRKDKARKGAGSKHVAAGREARATKKQNRVFEYSGDYIANFVAEVRAQGLALPSTSSDTQLTTLPKLLQYLGPRGLSTYEGVAAGYLRVATRIKELKETWEIHTLRENVIAPDGLFHKGVGRYVLIGKRRDSEDHQGSLDLGDA